jgi:iron complex outermembrane receptor protein
MLLHTSMMAQFSIYGTVSDQDTKEALSGAHIILENTFLTAISDQDGQFKFTKLKEGIYQLKVTYIGYESITKEVALDKNTEVNFSLGITAFLQDEVVIRGIRTFKQEPPSFTNISDKEISTENLGQDLPYIMALSPSTVVSSDAGNGVGYTTIRIRGTDVTGINITLNGIPLNDPESHGVWWVNMPDLASSANTLQIQRGVGTSTNGAAAFGASINIQTNQFNADPYAQINSSAGSYNTFKNTLKFGTGLIKGRWAVDGRVSLISSDGYIDRASTNLKSFFLSGAYTGEKSIYRINISSGKEKTYQAWEGVPKDSLHTNRTYNPYTYENETDNYQQDHYQFFYTREISKQWRLNTALFYVRGRGYYEQYKDERKFSSYGLPDIIIGGDTITSTDLVQQKWLDNHFYGFTWSVNYKKNKIDLIMGGGWNRYDGDHYGKIIWAEYAANMDKDHEWYKNSGIKNDLNFYAKANFQLSSKLNVYGDLQYRIINYRINGIHDDLRDISQKHDFYFFNPKLGLVYDISEKHRAYFSFGIANREPNRSAYRDALPGEEPTFESLYDYELGYKYSSSQLAFSGNLFYMDYNNQLVLTGKINNVGTPIMTNVKNSYRAGIEFQAGIKILKRLNWDLNASFSRNKIKDFTSYVDNWNYWDDPENEPYQYEEYLGETDISFSPGITAGSLLDYEMIDDLHISLASNYVGKQYIDNTSSDERQLNPYFLNDIRVMYTLRTEFIKEISFHFQLNNIFSVKYETNAWVYRYVYGGQESVLDGYFPQAPVNYFIGVGLKF